MDHGGFNVGGICEEDPLYSLFFKTGILLIHYFREKDDLRRGVDFASNSLFDFHMFDSPNRCVVFFFSLLKILPPIPGFDNDFFGIDLEEAQAISPSQRWVMEVGYEVGTGELAHGWEPSSHPWEVLWKAGWTKAGLRGQRIGSFMGDSGSEWNYIYLKQDRYQFPGRKI